jgi:DNA-binding NarL/FixJ family response regulator
MAAVAIYSTDAMMRDRLRAQLREAFGIAIAGVVDAVPALARLVETKSVDLVLADGLPDEQLSAWLDGHPDIPSSFSSTKPTQRTRSKLSMPAPRPSCRARLSNPRSRPRSQVPSTVSPPCPRRARHAARTGSRDAPLHIATEGTTPLPTPRESRCSAAMADGASNKTIARRLRSHSTRQFHVARS